jgi:hypothetical protein
VSQQVKKSPLNGCEIFVTIIWLQKKSLLFGYFLGKCYVLRKELGKKAKNKSEPLILSPTTPCIVPHPFIYLFVYFTSSILTFLAYGLP